MNSEQFFCREPVPSAPKGPEASDDITGMPDKLSEIWRKSKMRDLRSIERTEGEDADCLAEDDIVGCTEFLWSPAIWDGENLEGNLQFELIGENRLHLSTKGQNSFDFEETRTTGLGPVFEAFVDSEGRWRCAEPLGTQATNSVDPPL